MQRRFRRLAIVNRGEPAMRVIRAVRELNYERDEQIRLIALYTDAESEAMFVRDADEAVCVGPSTVAARDGARRSAYLDHAALERALRAARADAAWVGWGFVAEHPEFVELCDGLGIVFVGPDAAMMRCVGDKIEAKRLAEAAGVPVAPWSGGPVETFEEAEGHAERIGFPLMVKAAAGGGGRGIRRVDAAGELPAVFASARSEALQAFGDGTLFLERLVTPARHVEVQVIADGAGRKPSAGSSALKRASIAWPDGSGGSPSSRPAAATCSWSLTRSSPVTASVTGCSACRRALTSMNEKRRSAGS